MKKRTRFKSRRSDAFIVLVCILVCGVSLMLFWKDLNRSSIRNDKNKIASIYFKHKIAQRKFNDRVVWERLSQNSPLYNEDTIRTADFAQAVIKFKDGTVLDIYENTMLQIYYSESEGVKINVDGGDILVDSSTAKKSVEVAMAGNKSVVKLEAGSRLEAKTSSAGEVQNFEVKSGTASVVTISEDGEKKPAAQVIKAGESVNVEKSGEISKNPLTVTSISKDLRILNVKQEPVPVKLEWKIAGDVEDKSKIIIQTSRTKDFSKIEKSYVPKGDSIEVPADSGILYWRVFDESAEEKPVSGKVTVETVMPVEAVSPASGSEFRYRTNLPGINFNWKGNEYADHYKLEVSESRDMKNPVFSQELTVQNISLNTLPEGQYYWRVTPYYSLNDTGYVSSGEVKPFSIVKNQMLKPPSLTVPAENAKMTYKENLSAQFMWKSELKDASYDLYISTDKDFENIVRTKTVSGTRVQEEFSPDQLRDGKYYWKVVRHSSDPDDLNPVSEIRSFAVAKHVAGVNRLIYPPEIYSVEEMVLPGTKFIWKLADEYKDMGVESILQISKNKDFSQIVEEIPVKGTIIDNVSLKNGNYYWRVGIRNQEEELSAFTDPRSLKILKELEKAEFISPAEKSVHLTYENKPTTVSWKSVPGAEYYDVKIYGPDGNVVSGKSGVKENSAIFILPANEYKCSVQPMCEETEFSPMRTGKIQTVSFVLRDPVPVQLVSPSASQTISGLDAIRSPVTFTWKNGEDKVFRSQFILYKVQPNGSLKEVSSINNPGYSISLNRLTEGSYRWVVKASTMEGIPLDSQMKNFVVTQIPLLGPARLETPEKNMVIGPVYLRKNRNILFQWEPVPGATDYSFNLYIKNKDGTLKQVYSEKTGKNTEVKFKNLAMLDVGDFEWNVTAYSHAKDGFEEQHGKVSTGNFTISFELPEKVKTIKPGRMYGD